MDDPALRQHLELTMLAGVSTAPPSDVPGAPEAPPAENAGEGNGYFFPEPPTASNSEQQNKSTSDIEQERAYIRKAKARERQRRKRAKDRISLGLPPTPLPRVPKNDIPKRYNVHANETEEERKDRIRLAARLRQQKHRANVRLRRQQELDNPMAHEPYPYQDLLPMAEAPNLGYPANAGLFVNTLLLALAADPPLRSMLMRLYSINEEDFPSLEQTLASAFDQWNHSRYTAHAAAAFGQHPGMLPEQFDGGNWPAGALVPTGGPRPGPSGSAVYPGAPTGVPPGPSGEAAVANQDPRMIQQQQQGVPGAPGANNFYPNAHNQEPPHFRRSHATTSSARNEGGEEEGDEGEEDDEEYTGEGDEEDGDGDGIDGSGPRTRSAAVLPSGMSPEQTGPEGDGDVEMSVQQQQQQQPQSEPGPGASSNGGPPGTPQIPQQQQQHPQQQAVDPQEEAHKLWSAFWEARGHAEARARGLAIPVQAQNAVAAVAAAAAVGVPVSVGMGIGPGPGTPSGTAAGVPVGAGVPGPSGTQHQ